MDLFTNIVYKRQVSNPLKITLQPYQVVWLYQKHI